jgi:hypothetical protein
LQQGYCGHGNIFAGMKNGKAVDTLRSGKHAKLNEPTIFYLGKYSARVEIMFNQVGIRTVVIAAVFRSNWKCGEHEKSSFLRGARVPIPESMKRLLLEFGPIITTRHAIGVFSYNWWPRGSHITRHTLIFLLY